MVKDRIEVDAVRAHLWANDRSKKRIATGFAGRREAGQDLLGAGSAEELVGRFFDRVATMHTTPWEYEIESRFEAGVHYASCDEISRNRL